jgi:serine/threonine protein kinase
MSGDSPPALAGGPAEAWARLEPVLDELLDLEPPLRLERLAQLAAADASLAREVGAALTAAERDGGLPRLDELVAAVFAEPLGEGESSRHGERVGAFVLGAELGRGGMGTVYAAERADGGFEQQVAIKLSRRGVGAEELRRRFVAERRILARLEHSNIARLVDGGVTADGLPWFAMERVDGVPITRWAEERRLGLPERLALFLAVCDAVAFAHERQVVHRDLKAANVLVDGAGRVKLLDFGIAKLLDESEEGLTRAGAPMTPRYAAPEQRQGANVTPATDVWQLGRLLDELLPKTPPRPVARIVARASEE